MIGRATLCALVLISSACGGTVSPLDGATSIDIADRSADDTAAEANATGDTARDDRAASDGPDIAVDVAADSHSLDAREDIPSVGEDVQDVVPSDTRRFDDALDEDAERDAPGADADDASVTDVGADAANPADTAGPDAVAAEDVADVSDMEVALDGSDPDSPDADLDALDIDAGTDASAEDAGEPADADAACPVEAPVRCGGVCVADTDSNPMRCGAACEMCPIPANGAAACVAGSCTATCNAGRVLIGGECLDAPAPRPVRPMTNSRMTVANPTLRWVLPSGIDGARVTICSDRPCSVVELEVDAVGGSLRVPRELAAGVWYWKLRSLVGGGPSTVESATWQFRTPAASAPVESAWVSRPDFNGDGLDDFGVNSNTTGNGAVYYGNRGESTAPGTEIPGSNANTWLLSMGDIDGDGFSDFEVDVNFASDTGHIEVRSGRERAGTFDLLNAIPHSIARAGFWLDGAGDVDGDGYSDAPLLTPTYAIQLFRGGPSGLGFGSSVTTDTTSYSAAVLDADADGFDDLLIAGSSVRWARGGPAGVAEIRTLISTPEARGWSFVFGIGDVNRDGYLDAAWVEQRSAPPRILASLIVGSAAGPTAGALQDVVPDGESQLIVGPVGDADGDGIVDVSATSGSVWGLNVVHSRETGFDRADSTQISLGCTAGESHEIGDWNGDGSVDSVVQCGNYAWILFMDHSGTSSTPRLVPVEPARTGEVIGFSVM